MTSLSLSRCRDDHKQQRPQPMKSEQKKTKTWQKFSRSMCTWTYKDHSPWHWRKGEQRHDENSTAARAHALTKTTAHDIGAKENKEMTKFNRSTCTSTCTYKDHGPWHRGKKNKDMTKIPPKHVYMNLQRPQPMTSEQRKTKDMTKIPRSTCTHTHRPLAPKSGAPASMLFADVIWKLSAPCAPSFLQACDLD